MLDPGELAAEQVLLSAFEVRVGCDLGIQVSREDVFDLSGGLQEGGIDVRQHGPVLEEVRTDPLGVAVAGQLRVFRLDPFRDFACQAFHLDYPLIA